MSNINHRNELLAALENLRYTKCFTLVSIDESVLEDQTKVQEYFDAPFDSETEEQFEKVVAVSMVKTAYANEKSENTAKKYARKAVEAFRYAKLDYKYETETISAKEYQKRIKQNKVAQTHAIVKSAVKTAATAVAAQGARLAVGPLMGKVALALGAPAVPALVVTAASYVAVRIIEKITPKPVKEKIKNVAREVTSRCIDMSKRAVTQLKNNCQKVAEKVSPVINKISTSLQKVGEVVKNTWSTAKQKAKSWIKKISW